MRTTRQMRRRGAAPRWLVAAACWGLALTLCGCATQADLLEQDRKLSTMIEQQSRAVESMRRDLEHIRTDMGRRGTPPSPRSGPARPAPKPAPANKPEDTSMLPAVPGQGIGMTLSPEGVSSEDAPVPETVVTSGPQSAVPAAAVAPAAASGGFVGEAVAATPPPGAEVQRGAPGTADPEWRREVAQERAVAKASGAAAPRAYVDALEGLEQGDCKKAMARLKAASDSGGALSDNAMYWQAKCLAARGNERKATARLGEVAARYPKSDKAPAALWAQAELQLRSGDSSAARGTFSRLVKDYPASAEASRAKKKLAELN